MSPAGADEWDKKTILTFSQRFEIPGHVLPAGTYMFKLADTLSDRHIVQVFSADGKTIIATVMTIPDYRLKTTSDTVVRFNEVPRGAPDAIRAWFYPGNSVGQEFVYPKSRAAQLARTTKVVVPAVAVADVADVNALKAAPIVGITPDEKEAPVAAVIQTEPLEDRSTVARSAFAFGQSEQDARNVAAQNARNGAEQAARNAAEQNARNAAEENARSAADPRARNAAGQSARTTLPETASAQPLILLAGLVSIGFGTLLLMLNGRVRAATPAK
jgi:hypothetical protein